MNYQEILCYPYVINLINVLIKEKQINQQQQYKIDLVKLEDKFYIKAYNDALYLIKEDIYYNNNLVGTDMKKLLSILDTCIHFEEYKNKPLDSYLYRIKHEENINYKKTNNFTELLKQLQFQYITNKSYFDN